MLPGDMWATAKQVANFYGVSDETVKTVVKRNYDELAEDGYRVWKAEDFRKVQDELFLNVTTSKRKFTASPLHFFSKQNKLPTAGLRIRC